VESEGWLLSCLTVSPASKENASIQISTRDKSYQCSFEGKKYLGQFLILPPSNALAHREKKTNSWPRYLWNLLFTTFFIYFFKYLFRLGGYGRCFASVIATLLLRSDSCTQFSFLSLSSSDFLFDFVFTRRERERYRGEEG